MYVLIQNACPYMNFMKHADIYALDIPHIVLEIISFVYFSMAVHAYTIVHKCSPSPAECTSINKTFLRKVIGLTTERISKGPQEDVALGLEVFRETKRLEDKAQNLEDDAMTVEKWERSLSK